MSEHSTTQASATVVTSYLERIQGPLGAYTFALVGDPYQAHDIVQEVVVQAQRVARDGNPPFRGDTSEDAMRHWLVCRAYRRAVSARGFEGREKSLQIGPVPQLDCPYPVVQINDPLVEACALHAEVAALGPEDAACVLLSVVYGFTLAQIAAMLEVQPGVVKKRLAHAKRRLRDAYFAAGARKLWVGR